MNTVIRRLQAEINAIQELEDQAEREEQERKTWWRYLLSSRTQKMEEQKEERERVRLQRVASKSIKTHDLATAEAKLQRLEDAMVQVKEKMNAENQAMQNRKLSQKRDEWRRQDEAEAARRAREAQAQAREARERERARQKKESAKREHAEREHAAMQAQEAQAAREREAAEERKRTETEAQERQRREAQEQGRQRAGEKARAKARAAGEAETRRSWRHQPSGGGGGGGGGRPGEPLTSTRTHGACQHKRYWEQTSEGVLICENCWILQRRFVFECPGCNIRACENCRKVLKWRAGAENDKR